MPCLQFYLRKPNPRISRTNPGLGFHLSKDPNAKVGRVIKPQALVQRRDALDLVGREVKVGRVQVLRQPLLAVALGDDDDAALRRPPQQDLRRRFAVLLGDAGHGLVLEEWPDVESALVLELEEALRAEGRVGRHGDAVLLAHLDEARLDEVGVMLDLVDGGWDTRVAEDVVEQGRVEVRHTDGTEDPVWVVLGDDERLEGLPGLLDGDWDLRCDVLLGGVGPEAERRRRRVRTLYLLLRSGEVEGPRSLTMGTSARSGESAAAR